MDRLVRGVGLLRRPGAAVGQQPVSKLAHVIGGPALGGGAGDHPLDKAPQVEKLSELRALNRQRARDGAGRLRGPVAADHRPAAAPEMDFDDARVPQPVQGVVNG